ncbi:hypothetical protein LUW76_12915 [Actinomadura madurae]|nr:hypothetical protein [Actinomadura madurae]URM95142.1 hypothetical protein LUW76_12915 [Actinomadura madurae]
MRSARPGGNPSAPSATCWTRSCGQTYVEGASGPNPSHASSFRIRSRTGEIGPAGREPERALRRVAAETGVRLLGATTSGFLALARGLTASLVPGAVLVPSGGIGPT